MVKMTYIILNGRVVQMKGNRFRSLLAAEGRGVFVSMMRLLVEDFYISCAYNLNDTGAHRAGR